jgi:hypothetical protein
MQSTGHNTRSVFERYDIVSECDLVEAATKLNAMQPLRLRRIKIRYFRSSRAQFGHSRSTERLPPINEPLNS